MYFGIEDLECISQYQYLSSNKRYITKRGKEWMKNFKEQLTTQMKEGEYEMLDCENIEVEIEMVFCNKRKNDIDNGLHYILDGMEGIVYKNDRYIKKLTASKSYKKKYEGMMNVKISVCNKDILDEKIKEINEEIKISLEKQTEILKYM